MQTGPKILLLDIETAPIRAWVWGLFKQNIAIGQIDKDWWLLCIVMKWFKEDTFYTSAIWDDWDRFLERDEGLLLQIIWEALDEADIVVAHNGDRFDVAKINAKFFEYGMPPPSPYKIVDTLKSGRAAFGFTSHRLDYVDKLLGGAGKLKTDFDLWVDIMNGDKQQMAYMLGYNVEDVALLENYYERLLPWITNHPNHNVYQEEGADAVCSHCGSTNFHKRGFAYTNTGKYQRIRCKDCGGWGKYITNQISLGTRREMPRNVAK